MKVLLAYCLTCCWPLFSDEAVVSAQLNAFLRTQLAMLESATELADIGTVISLGDGIARVANLRIPLDDLAQQPCIT